MHRVKRLILCFLIISGCIEPYEFVVKDKNSTLVVEGSISNVSYNESLLYLSDGRFFTVRLRKTSDVINLRGEMVSNASVSLISSSGEEWFYSESPTEAGTYILKEPAFEAVKGTAYKLRIKVADGEEAYESEWEEIPASSPAKMGTVGFEEVEKQVYEMVAGEWQISTKKGINFFLNLPENKTGKPVYYRWDFTPTWIYIAPLAFSSQPGYKCWATNENYLSGFALQADLVGGYKKDLVFIETVRNERLFESLSVLVHQYSMTEDFFYFWKEMQEQVEEKGLSDKPPYNLKTNIKSVNSDRKVSGYFGVVEEKAERVYVSIKDLSYYVRNTLKDDCLRYQGPDGPAPECRDCREYPKGKTTDIMPVWWK